MSDHLFFLAEHPGSTIHAVEMLPVAQVFAVRGTTFQSRAVPVQELKQSVEIHGIFELSQSLVL